MRNRLAACFATIIVVVFTSNARADTANIDLVKDFVASYNRHSVADMMTYCSEGIRWLTIGDTDITIETEGKDALSKAMVDHFARSPNTVSELVVIEGDGPMVVAIEQASAAGGKSQCAASVYKVVAGLIQDVWYFDVYACDGRLLL